MIATRKGETELMAYTTEEGGEWHFVWVHSIVVDDMRWDVRARTWAKYFEPVRETWKRTIDRLRGLHASHHLVVADGDHGCEDDSAHKSATKENPK